MGKNNKISKLSPAVETFVEMLSMQIALRQLEGFGEQDENGDVILVSMNHSRSKMSVAAADLAVKICATNWASYTSEEIGIPFEKMGLQTLAEPQRREAAAEFYRLRSYAFDSLDGRNGKSKAEKELGISRQDTVAMYRYLD